MQVHWGSLALEGEVGVEIGRRRPAALAVELSRPLPPRLPPAEPPPRSNPPRPTPPPVSIPPVPAAVTPTPPPTLVLLSSFKEYEELAFRENLKAGDYRKVIKRLIRFHS